MKYFDIDKVLSQDKIFLPSDRGDQDLRLTLYIRQKRTTIRIEPSLFDVWVYACDGEIPSGSDRREQEERYRAELEDILQQEIDVLDGLTVTNFSTNQRLIKSLIHGHLHESLLNRLSNETGQGAL